jgi:mannose-1-phosphate guanylyltransferase/mannose-6-phosphate isomerase
MRRASPSGAPTAIDCHDTLLRSEDDGMELVGIGLTTSSPSPCPMRCWSPMDRAQDVKLAVDALKAKRPAGRDLPRDHRPWGWFETLVLADRFQVKRIVVHPGAALSLQSHFHRSEHWIVVRAPRG